MGGRGGGVYLYNGVDMDEVEALDLMRFNTMGTLHLRKNRYDLLRQRSDDT